MWLEKVEGKKALQWATKQNKESTSVLEKVPGFKSTNEKILSILNADKKIPYANKRGSYLYNFWQDDKHIRGVYRRTRLKEYRKENPKWEIILDIDTLAKKEKENWVFQGTVKLSSNNNRLLIKLSRGGADAVVMREFDISKKSFVKNGFYLPEAKSLVAWKNINTLYVATDFGKDSLSTSGYPRIVKLWQRGTELKEAKTIFEAAATSVGACGYSLSSGRDHIDLIDDAKTFYKSDIYLFKGGKLSKINIPEDADVVGYLRKQVIIFLKSNWQVGRKKYKQGSVIVAKLSDLISGQKQFHTLIEPGKRSSIFSVDTTQNKILITLSENVVSKVLEFTQNHRGKWHQKLIEIEKNGTASVFGTSNKNDDYFISYQNFLTPDSLYMVLGKNDKKEKLKNLPAFFDSNLYKIQQLEAISKDGTKIPYFVIARKDIKLDGQNPTLLYGYGGFQFSLRPSYLATIGSLWLSKGGIYVQANIRGGGEFGPKWHQAGLKKNRNRVFEDFIAVAESLIESKITSPKKLAIQGASNGGLLVATVFIKRPDLFNSVVCQVPLLDMKRYHKLLAGASWIAEYGDPDDPGMWKFIKTYSPYHNVKKGIKYPSVFFTTSTRDDRVHPAHARKMVAKMKDMGHNVFYYENMEGGHSGAANNQQRAYVSSLIYSYLFHTLMD